MARSRRAVFFLALAVVAATAGCGDAPRLETKKPVVSAPANPPRAANPSRVAPRVAVAAPGASLAAAPSRAIGRSPLEAAPGYFPPDDPESASVRLGRREASPVADEFVGGAASLEDFAGRIVEALNTMNEPGLHELRVTRKEFEAVLWPEFPESRPITRITADDAWSLSEPRSVTAASRAMGLQGGKHLRLVRVEHAPVQEFTNFQLYRGVTIFAADETNGEVLRIRVAPSVAARHGRYKALLFRD